MAGGLPGPAALAEALELPQRAARGRHADAGAPDPMLIEGVEELVPALRDVRVWALKPTLREQGARGRGVLTRSSLSEMLNGRVPIPPYPLPRLPRGVRHPGPGRVDLHPVPPDEAAGGEGELTLARLRSQTCMHLCSRLPPRHRLRCSPPNTRRLPGEPRRGRGRGRSAPGLTAALDYLRDGDRLTVREVDRLGRTLAREVPATTSNGCGHLACADGVAVAAALLGPRCTFSRVG